MLLDWQPVKGQFTLHVDRSEADVQELMKEQGLNLSAVASTGTTAVLFTDEPYAAAVFHQHATDRARAVLAPLLATVEASWATEHEANFRCPPDKELSGYQKANLAYALGRKHTLVGDDPGLGKTMVGICFANELKAKRVLVCCPANLRHQWFEKIEEWAIADRHRRTHLVMNGRHGIDDYAQWVVVSYDLLRTPTIHGQLAKLRFDVGILDEAHYLKSIDSQRTRALFGGGRKALGPPIGAGIDRIMALTGTPLPNRPREAYVLARNLCWDSIDWASEAKFRERFNPSQLITGTRRDGTTFRRIDERSGRHGELRMRLRGNFMTRHRKRDVLTQLKLPVYDLIQVEQDDAVKAALLAESMLGIDPETLPGADAMVLGHVSAVRKQMGIAMAPHVARWIDMLVEGGEEKLVVFGWHIEVLDILERAWQKHGVTRIDGSTSLGQRTERKHRFITDPRTKVLLGNMQAMGIGTDGLQDVCSHALIAEPDWTPGNNIQAVDRLDRRGQKAQVQADIFVAPGSFAERILASALRKLRVTTLTLDGGA